MKFNGKEYKLTQDRETDEKYSGGVYDLSYALYNYVLWLEKYSYLDESAKVCEIYYALKDIVEEAKE